MLLDRYRGLTVTVMDPMRNSLPNLGCVYQSVRSPVHGEQLFTNIRKNMETQRAIIIMLFVFNMKGVGYV